MLNEEDLTADHGGNGSPLDVTGAPSPDVVSDVYERLHSLARHCFNEQPPDHTLQPTALIHEAYLRLAGQGRDWESPTHFYAVAAGAMRQILIDYARRRMTVKRGGDWSRVTLSERLDENGPEALDLRDLGTALERLEGLNERQCRIVELRYLAGFSIERTAEFLGISEGTVKLDWRMARAWLIGELRGG